MGRLELGFEVSEERMVVFGWVLCIDICADLVLPYFHVLYEAGRRVCVWEPILGKESSDEYVCTA